MPKLNINALTAKHYGLVLGPALFLLLRYAFSPPGLNPAAVAILASTVWIGVWWITEAIPIAATALLPIILFPLTGGLDIQTTTEAFGNPLVFLFIGGFIIAVAIKRWDLHRRIAINIIYILGSNSSKIILGFMIATAFLSMWISNTATAVMMVPIGMAIIAQMGYQVNKVFFGKALMLGIAYSASIGGVATLIGTPTNVIFSGIVTELYGVEITFARWMLFGVPISILLLFICWQYLVRIAFPIQAMRMPGGKAEIRRQLEDLGPITPEERLVLVVFATTAFAWITRSFLLNQILPGLNDTIIAIAGGLMLFLLPAPTQPGEQILDWKTARDIPWGVILLFGGGLAIAAGFKDSGLAAWIGDQLSLVKGLPLFLLLIILVGSVNFLTEITSNVATASMILPILASLAVAIDTHPFGIMAGVTMATSCAFMLPVATPPNAIVFGSNMLQIKDMVKAGVWMNLISILIVALFTYYVLPVVWGIELGHFPEVFRGR